MYIKRIMFWAKNYRLISTKKLNCDLRSLLLCQNLEIYGGGGAYCIGENVVFGYKIGGGYKFGYCELQCRTLDSKICIGNNVFFNNNLSIICCSKVSIGNDCMIGINCQIMDFDAHSINPEKRHQSGTVANIIIDDNVWIGNNVIILKGVHIGENSVVAAGAIVTKDIPANVVAAGVPARVIKNL